MSYISKLFCNRILRIYYYIPRFVFVFFCTFFGSVFTATHNNNTTLFNSPATDCWCPTKRSCVAHTFSLKNPFFFFSLLICCCCSLSCLQHLLVHLPLESTCNEIIVHRVRLSVYNQQQTKWTTGTCWDKKKKNQVKSLRQI